MRKKTKEKINHLINIGIFCSIIMAIFSVILLLQKRYFWAFLSMIGMIVGIASFWNLKKEMKLIKEGDSYDNN
ncbi:hypothetical protein K5E_23840 [Enterococcus thailandicus]|uniref:Uncharacterized protein n=1 Tax=bioreactor metagenome TaxID=1076179 RepID=A0A645G4V9_9ZZZZ|nr:MULTISPECIES: hypothetical protein [Enterococcus]MDK4351334.1 hypothetical protein [Enterococcus thailandicus]MDT2732933.1 hypothetical protein [Enterococcus thailandicus]MEA4830160.1 hypothetical protein [Enterococcus thailandicus]OTP24559.1 hypothetical protein A5800_002419 [Enterococcus sp. 5B7_DIV0075]GMC03612.1 hypothetical protein K4E_11340 [Enterococcus thailandicus]